MQKIIRSLVTTLVLLCFGLLPRVQAVVPPPDGGYPNFTTAEGQNALFSLTENAGYNTAVGWYSLFANIDGNHNTAVGAGALALNTGDNNTATGTSALLLNDTGTSNTANGAFALFSNTTGNSNTAIGDNALTANVDGYGNIAIGPSSMVNNVGGNLNIVVGALSGGNLINGVSNIYIGTLVAPSTDETATIRIADNALPVPGANSRVFIGGISNSYVGAGNAPVVINGAGQLGTLPSSSRFKKDIQSMDKSSEVIYSLRPVTFHYKGDETNTACSGLIAEEVAKVEPSLILLDEEGKPQTVRYEQINAMLLNEFLKEHRELAELKSIVVEQRKGIEAMAAQLKEQAAQIQKVSAQIETSKPAPQVVNNP